MRLFLAIDPKLDFFFKNLQQKILQPGLRPASSFHLTLKFLGEADASSVINEIKSINFKPFRLNTTGLGVFPNREKIRVVWLGIEHSEALLQLHNHIEEALTDYRSDYDFHPHITLARVNYLEGKNRLLCQLDKGVEKKEFDVKNIILYKSKLTPSGPVYSEVHRIFSIS